MSPRLLVLALAANAVACAAGESSDTPPASGGSAGTTAGSAGSSGASGSAGAAGTSGEAGASGAAGEGASGGTSGAAGEGGAGTGGASTTCSGLLELPEDSERKIRVGGRERSYRLHVPASYDRTRQTPLVLVFHAYLSDAPQMILYGGFNSKADEAGFIAVHPQGVGNSWNAGACCGEGQRQNIDDVGFVRALLDDVAGVACIDEKRVFASGMSNGGFMSHRIGCELADRVAAIAPVAGVLGIPSCTPSRPVPVLHFHGTLDTVVPFGGSVVNGFRSVDSTIDAWKRANGCTGDSRETFSRLDSRCEAWQSCAAGSEVSLCTVTGGGHTWPGGLSAPAALDATDAAWEFFQRHPMP